MPLNFHAIPFIEQMTMSNALTSTFNSLSIVTLIALLSACSEDASQQIAADSIVRPAKILTVQATQNNTMLSYPAIIDSQNLTTLAFEVGGRLSKISVVDAQHVKRGELLAKLDQQNLNAKLTSAQAQYNNANKEYQRALRLIKADAISRSELDKRKSQHDIDKAGYISAKKALQDSVILAPFDGNIAKVSVTLQQVVQPGEAAIVILGSGGLEAKFNLPSSVIARAKDNNAKQLDAYITLDSAPGIKLPATFKQVTLTADANSQTHEVTFSFSASSTVNILPGMNAVAWFKDPSSQSASGIQVPLTAITSQANQKYVWVVAPHSMQVRKRAISIADSIGETITVVDGLQAGESIVVAGVSFLAEGMRVRPWSSKP